MLLLVPVLGVGVGVGGYGSLGLVCFVGYFRRAVGILRDVLLLILLLLSLHLCQSLPHTPLTLEGLRLVNNHHLELILGIISSLEGELKVGIRILVDGL
jgi:hypothetical protein